MLEKLRQLRCYVKGRNQPTSFLPSSLGIAKRVSVETISDCFRRKEATVFSSGASITKFLYFNDVTQNLEKPKSTSFSILPSLFKSGGEPIAAA